MTVYYTRRAEQALDEIASHTLETWGAPQRDRYMALLEYACEVQVSALWHAAREVPGRHPLRMLRCERLVIYFRAVDDGFEIVHVLHERQLPRRHL